MRSSSLSSQLQAKWVTWLPWIICSLAALFYFYEYILRIAPSVMTQQVMVTYHLNARTFGNLSAYFYYIYAPLQLVVGMLIDRYGPRRLLTAAVLICSLGSFLYASTHSLVVAEIGRLLMGLGSAFAFVGVLKLATIWLPSNRLALVSGATVAAGMLGGVLGDHILTTLVAHQGWKLTWYFIAMIGLILTLAIFLVIRDHNHPSCRVDCEPAPRFREICSGCWQLMKNKYIWLNGLIGLLLYLPVSGFAEAWQIPFLRQTARYTHSQAAMATSMVFLGWAVGAPIIGWISDTIKQRRLPITIAATAAAILLAYVIYVPHISRSLGYSLLFVFGFFSSAQAIAFPISREISPNVFTATAIALTNAIIMLSGISVWIIGTLLESTWQGDVINGVHAYSASDYQMALIILPLALVAAVFLTFFMPETYGKSKVKEIV